MPHRGKRLQLTLRLPPDLYAEVARRARGRGWSLSDYVAWCVANEIRPKRRHDDPLGLLPQPGPKNAPPGGAARSGHLVLDVPEWDGVGD